MPAGDWAAGSRLVLDSVHILYNDQASPPTVGSVIVQWRTQLPSGGFTEQREFVFQAPAGTTSRQVIARLSTGIQNLQTNEGLAP